GCVHTGKRTPAARNHPKTIRVCRVISRNQQAKLVVGGVRQTCRSVVAGFTIVVTRLPLQLQPVIGIPGQVVEESIVNVTTGIVVLRTIVVQTGTSSQRLTAGECIRLGLVFVTFVEGTAGRITEDRAYTAVTQTTGCLLECTRVTGCGFGDVEVQVFRTLGTDNRGLFGCLDGINPVHAVVEGTAEQHCNFRLFESVVVVFLVVGHHPNTVKLLHRDQVDYTG